MRVLIAGGGPAGIATAISLARRGIASVIAEPSISPNAKAGETIPPNAMPLLIKLGIDDLLTASAHLPCYGNRFIWGENEPVDKEFLSGTHSQGWHVNRSYFEKQLKEYSEETGVHWLCGWRITNCNQVKEGWEVSMQNDEGTTQSLICDFIADATGRACRIARLLGHQRTRLDSLIGLWSVFDVSEQIKPYYTFIESTPAGWWYAAPLQDKKLSLAFMTDADLLEQPMKECSFFLQAARNTELIKSMADKIVVKEYPHPSINPASTSFINQRYGSNWLAVGDAAYAYDPLSSYGMVSALEAGYYAGHAIADSLAGNADALAAYDFLISQAFDIYRQMYMHQYALEKRWQNEFWKRRTVVTNY